METNGLLKAISVIALALIGLICACSDQQLSGNRKSDATDSAYLPDSEVTGATYYLYEKGRITTRIVADSTRTYESLDSTTAYDLDIYFMDESGRVTSNLVSDSGIIREQAAIHHIYGNLVFESYDSAGLVSTHLVGDWGIIREHDRVFEIFGKVVAVSEQNRKLETDYLRWNSVEDMIDTDRDVKFTKPDGTVLRGRGFEADRQLNRARILHRVSGTWIEAEDSNE